jgi:hypothetical protein
MPHRTSGASSLPALRPQRRVHDDPIALSASEGEHRWQRRVPAAERLPGEGKRDVVLAAAERERRQPTGRFLGYGQLVGS